MSEVAQATGQLVSVAIGDRSGIRKRPVESGQLRSGHGLVGDRHADGGPRQLSLLDAAVLEAMRSGGMTVGPGALGENLLIAGIPLDELQPGTRLQVGAAVVEITQPRPACRNVREVDPRALKALVGRSGRMARVVTSGEVHPGDSVHLVGDENRWLAADDAEHPEQDDQAERHAKQPQQDQDHDAPPFPRVTQE